MFGKKKTRDPAAAEAKAKERRRMATHLPKSVKQLIGYDAMLRNGIASLGDDRWSATILFQDITSTGGPSSSTASRPGKACRSPPTRAPAACARSSPT